VRFSYQGVPLEVLSAGTGRPLAGVRKPDDYEENHHDEKDNDLQLIHHRNLFQEALQGGARRAAAGRNPTLSFPA
jgi:hypothetical protein